MAVLAMCVGMAARAVGLTYQKQQADHVESG